MGRDDCVLQDKLNHASLIDAGRACDAKLKRYAHNDTTALIELLQKQATGRTMIMTDGVFSMDGDIAPLAELKRIADTHESLLVIDEAHGFGVTGKGRGSAAQAGILPTDNVLLMGTLGKAAGSYGAFVAGDEVLIQHPVASNQTARKPTAFQNPPVTTSTAVGGKADAFGHAHSAVVDWRRTNGFGRQFVSTTARDLGAGDSATDRSCR